ncbi:DUF6691 family protein [Shewanella halotolerans]|uniref:DUF6691 family protein n=1 Tax=Shewanella halotolerans TaxID=2864204 RepID=UPI001C65F597|nr:DUF6691 family protein [Shewanella halotolerans]QYJ90730.1 YeeE/YedE family protein [Shewanella halotolerans]
MRNLFALLSGLLFGAGLLLSGLADPAKVLAFLDISGVVNGHWDPSLMLVMGGALGVYLPVFLLWVKPRMARNQGPVLDSQYHLPSKTRIDGPLIVGAALFGLGWGMLGICPGPAVVNLASLDPMALAFMATMVLGAYLGRLISRMIARRLPGPVEA